MTISFMPLEAKYSFQFGIARIDEQGKVKNFTEKPRMSSKKNVFASMGNYIFNTNFLIDVLEHDAKRETNHDFGKDIIPYLIKKKAKVYAYDFSKNKIPSLKKYEAKYYWKDVGSISSYWQANMDILGEKPKLALDNPQWPIYASNLECPPAYISGSEIENSLIAEGAQVRNSKIKNSILGRSVKVEQNCVIEDSIIMDFTHIRKSSHLKRVIVDRFNTVSENSRMGYHKDKDKEKYFVDTSGIVVVERGSRKAFYY
jgi:glucose-1-phosphate adenylyltransferase